MVEVISGIIAFLFENIFILAIVFGAIYSFLGKLKQENTGNSPAPVNRPTVTRTLQDYQRKLEQSAEEAKGKAERWMGDTGRTADETAKKVQDIPDALAEYEKEHELLRHQAEAAERRMDSIHLPVDTAPKTKKEIPAFSKNPLVNGLIMSEVLSPPRSKRKRRGFRG